MMTTNYYNYYHFILSNNNKNIQYIIINYNVTFCYKILLLSLKSNIGKTYLTEVSPYIASKSMHLQKQTNQKKR